MYSSCANLLIKYLLVIFVLLFGIALFVPALAQKKYQLKSPDERLLVDVFVGHEITYSVSYDGEVLLLPSPISMQLEGGPDFGINSHLKRAKRTSCEAMIPSPFYIKSMVTDCYNQLTLDFKECFRLEFRAYDEGMAYRFVADHKTDFTILNEQAEYHFAKDWDILNPYVEAIFVKKHIPIPSIEEQFENSFERYYNHSRLSELDSTRLSFTPIMIKSDKGTKICLAESNVENYPGMFVRNMDKGTTLTGVLAPYPKECKKGGLYNPAEEKVLSREKYLSKSEPDACFPWRIMSVATRDEQLLGNDMVYRLASPSRIEDTSWIKPGLATWNWWSENALYNVDFRVGMNTPTFKAYIDFAAKYHLPYCLIDAGWYKGSNMFDIVPSLDLKEVIEYGKSKQVDVILWAGFYEFRRDMEQVCKFFSEMGVKGFKVDFIEHDDAKTVKFHYDAAAITARYRLVLDFHGCHKPTGLHRTYPNVLNYEAVYGQEQMKWNDPFMQPRYDVIFPFIRMTAGPVDYTQGAMNNKPKPFYRHSIGQTVSQGTRCHQLAEYVVFYSPLSMLCDGPSRYEREREYTEFIASIPTVWDETVPLKSEIGEYIAVARRSGDVWFVGALTNENARELTIDLSFLGEGYYRGTIFSDGPNCERFGEDYLKKEIEVPIGRKLTMHLGPAGGWVMKIMK